jgi:FKBP-type peptidyl-prolyl cis-trans isomerase SlyD
LASDNPPPQAIADGVVVQFHYTLTNDEGTIIDSSDGRDPLPYLHGAGNIVPGLERQMEGKRPGDHFRAVVEPGEGYGERSERPLERVPLDAFPPGVIPQEGMQFLVEGPGGQPMPIWVSRVTPEAAFIDFNHPLAGVRLNFDVQVVELRPATDQEVEHGHPHGGDGSHGH